MIDRLKWSLKRRARRWAGRAETLRSFVSGESETSEPVRVQPEPLPEPAPTVDLSPLAPSPDVEQAPETAVEPEPVVEEAPAEGAMTMGSVQEILDDLIRPALQSDGGDCTLLKVEDDNVYLKLIGACNGCPSSTITLRMGIETVLKEEFPQMNELIQVEHSF